jgi:hypothetical protein
MVATGLSHPTGGLPVAGGATVLNIGGALGTTTSTRNLTTTLGTAGTTVWLSFLIKPNQTSIFDYMGVSFGAAGSQLFIGYQGTNFVLNKAGGGGTNVSIPFANIPFSVGQTAFVVMKVVFTAGVDTATLYINPTAGLPAPDSPPASTGTKIDLDIGTFAQIVISGGRGAANPSQLDEIRVATTYSEVGPLPVELSSFSAHATSSLQSVVLNWSTVTETNCYGFEVQKSLNGKDNFQTIPGSFLRGHETTLTPQQYSFTDATPVTTDSYYRLRQIDLDGTVHFTEAVAVSMVTGADGAAVVQNYPNPFNPTTVIKYTIAEARDHLPASGQAGGLGVSDVRLVVYDLLGREVAVLVDEKKAPGSYTVMFSAEGGNGQRLASGVYVCRLTAGDVTATNKLTLVR